MTKEKTDIEKQLETKEQDVGELTENITKLMNEQLKMQEELIQATAKVEEAEDVKKDLHDKMDKLAADLMALKGTAETGEESTE